MPNQKISRRDAVKTLGLGAAALAGGQSVQAQSDKRPNIIFILVDDMGWSDIGCYGGEVNTPNLDRLAQGGVRFSQMHNTAKCFPSRACLLTGLYAQQCNMSKKHSHFENCTTIASALRQAGYRTLMTGKHHGLDNPYDFGFDRYFGLRDGACNHFNPGFQREGEPDPARKRDGRAWCIDDKTIEGYTPPEKDFYTTDYFTKYALQYLDEYKNEDKPFFLYLSYTAPHDPLMAWPDDIAKYRGKYKKGYAAIRTQRDKRQREMGLIDDTFKQSEPEHKDWDSLTPEQQDEEDLKMAVYCAMIDRVDQKVGEVLAKVREMGEEDNTLVLFASDNGCSAEMVRSGKNSPWAGEIGSMARWTSLGGDWANVSNTPFRLYKNYSHEGGVCTPMIAYWPERLKQPGRISEACGHFIDVMPTLLEAAGADYPAAGLRGEAIPPMEGESFLSALEGDDWTRQRPIFWQWSKGKSVRAGQWKLVSWDGNWELYDMDVDKTETRDLAAERPDVVKRLAALYDEWWKRVEPKT